MRSNMFGFFDILLGLGFWLKYQKSYCKYDLLAEPERRVGKLMKKAWTLTTDLTEVVSIAGSFESVTHYQ